MLTKDGGANYWLNVFTESNTRAVEGVLMLVRDGLKVPPQHGVARQGHAD